MWDETRSRGPGFDDLDTTVLKDVPVLIEVRTDEYEMLDRFITIKTKGKYIGIERVNIKWETL